MDSICTARTPVAPQDDRAIVAPAQDARAIVAPAQGARAIVAPAQGADVTPSAQSSNSTTVTSVSGSYIM